MSSTRLQEIQKMLETEPQDDFLNYALAVELEASGKLEEAIAQLQKLLGQNESYLGAYYKLGKLFEAKADESGALIVYKKGLEVAKAQKNNKAAGELSEAIWMLED